MGITFARLSTPIHRLAKTSADTGKEIYLWRDDLTGFIESGNKIRKLEFLLADAIEKNCNVIVTCGGPQSNHTRATSAAARALGIEVTILSVKPKNGFEGLIPTTGNLLLNQIFGAEFVWISPEEYEASGSVYDSFLTREANRLTASGKSPYVIPLGGSNAIGCMGYVSGVQEMLQTWKSLDTSTDAPDDLFCALGSAGTFVGIHLGLEKSLSFKTRVHGVNIFGPKEIAENRVKALTKAASERLSIPHVNVETQLIGGYVGGGYAVASDEDLAFYAKFARDEGILLDPCYTGKAFWAMLNEIRKNPKAFGNRILFLHSGGGFGNFAYSGQYQKMLTLNC